MAKPTRIDEILTLIVGIDRGNKDDVLKGCVVLIEELNKLKEQYPDDTEIDFMLEDTIRMQNDFQTWYRKRDR